jgi:DNA-binding transcriptional LysR family regulator
MDIRRLQHLVMLADKANYARAAEQLHLSQPALTRSVQAAEEEFAMKLFERGAGEVRPTAAGQFVLERARELVRQSRNLQRDVQLYRDRQMGDTACGFGPFPAQFLLPPLLQQARKAFAAVHVRAIMGNWQQLLQRLKDDEIEFFVAETRELPAGSDYGTRPAPQPGGLYVRSGHPLLQSGKPISRWPICMPMAWLPCVCPNRARCHAPSCSWAMTSICWRWSATMSTA